MQKNMYSSRALGHNTCTFAFEFIMAKVGLGIEMEVGCTANIYRQTTDKLMFKSVISTVR